MLALDLAKAITFRAFQKADHPPVKVINMTPVIKTLKNRGLLQDCTEPNLDEILSKRSVSVYAGFDPSAPMLHLGNLIPILLLKHFQLAGHRPIALVGGGTGMIGDPSGKRAERTLMTEEMVRANVQGIKKILEKYLDFEGENAAIVVNNGDWLGKIGFIEFLRDTGKYFRIGDMLGKESVRSRVNSEIGISFTEFSYMLLQAYDFKYLRENYDCVVQAGGSDQWGNITAGTELIRRTLGKEAYGVTAPLLTTAGGDKFGKSEQGAIWLDASATSPYDFYQYWIRQEDADVERFLKLFTFLPLEEVDAIVEEHGKDTSKRYGQKRLAYEMTRFIHGEEEATKARDASEALFSGALSDLSDERLRQLFPDVPSIEKSYSDLEVGLPILDLLVEANLTPSKKEAKRLLAQGGLYLNQSDTAVSAETRNLTPAELASETMLILRAGKKKYCLIQFTR